MKIRNILVAALLVPIGGLALAAVPSLVNYQGRLLDTAGNPRNGTFSMTFSVWDAASGGTQVWTETQPAIAVSNGVFAVQLGSVSPLTEAAFSDTARYLQVQIGGETATARQRLVSSPYAFRAGIADDLAAGDADYIQNRVSLQSGATFHVAGATVAGPLAVNGVITAGSSSHAITTAAGLVDATKLTGAVPAASMAGTYAATTAGGLLPGDTDYVQNTAVLQSGASFHVQSGSIAGALTATGTVTLGGAAGVSDVTVASNLIVNGAGPHVFAGDLRVNGSDLLDSGGTPRITLGSPVAFNAPLDVTAPETTMRVNVPIRLNGAANGDNYLAYPFTAGGTINAKDVVVISGANAVSTTTSQRNSTVIGFAVNGGLSGETVWVATSGIVTNVVAAASISAGSRLCTDSTAGQVQTCTTSGAVIGKALSGTSAAGQTLTVVINAGAN